MKKQAQASKLRRPSPQVAIIMGSKSDWETMKHTSDTLTLFAVSHVCKVVSAHRTPKKMVRFAEDAAESGIQVIIAGAGGAAHLPGMTASLTHIPVLGVPIRSKTLLGLDSLLSIAQMPKGIPVGTLAIGEAGAVNAALLAISILGLSDQRLARKLELFRRDQTRKVLRDKVS